MGEDGSSVHAAGARNGAREEAAMLRGRPHHGAARCRALGSDPAWSKLQLGRSPEIDENSVAPERIPGQSFKQQEVCRSHLVVDV